MLRRVTWRVSCHGYLSCDHHVTGAVRCVTVMKDFGMKLRRMGFQYLLQASGKVGVAGDVIEGGVTNDVIEGGVASDIIEGSVAGDVNHLLDHIEVCTHN